jgi:diguanylate cyclase (GGDEF)-like protein
MNQQLVDRIRQCQNLPSLPAIAMQVLDLAQRADVGIAEIAQIISRDPALSGKILRTVNSSFYARSQQIGTVSHAVTILGLQSVKTLVLGFSLVSNLTAKKGKGFKHLNYWKRSVYAATAARVLGQKVEVVQQEELFIATLLSDIGMLVLDRVLGDEYGDLCAKHERHGDLLNAEVEKYSMTHAEVGGLLAEEWKLPPVLQVPIRHHHDPDSVSDAVVRRLTELVGVAGQCADVFIDTNAAPAIATVRQTLLTRHQRPGTECDLLLGEISKKTREVASLFEINVGSTEDFETILKRANEALVDMTLRTQQQATVLERQASAANHLEAQNLVLKKHATIDPLTGLHNRTYFDAFLQKHFAAALAECKSLSVLMLDVDKFKSVNDKHGHAVGDTVLKALGKLLNASAKEGELAARFGGEEMVLVLPGATRQAAAASAEVVRKAIAARPIDCGNGLAIPITASVGVAALEPGTPFKEPAHLLKAADLALYAAKNAGRNCVRVFALGKPAPAAGATFPPPAASPAAA